jgi:phosphohistidine phosphatase
MNLFILRHGIAVEKRRPGHDAERQLTAKGERKIREAIAAIKAMRISFDLIFTSPYLRTEQTARLVAKRLGLMKRLIGTDTLEPGADRHEFLRLLKKTDSENVLIVGHEPSLSRLVSALISGSERSLVELKKGGLCKLSVPSLQHGKRATLEWLLTPRQLKSLGRV